jgi:hypothetical protein
MNELWIKLGLYTYAPYRALLVSGLDKIGVMSHDVNLDKSASNRVQDGDCVVK